MLGASTESLPGIIENAPGPPTLSLGSGSWQRRWNRYRQWHRIRCRVRVSAQGSAVERAAASTSQETASRSRAIIREVKPQYTSDAMRAKIQGAVLLQCTVRPDGSVTDIQVVRSLDPTFGLDQEAIKAARQWRFAPGTRMGQPVSVQITIELTFTLR